jgi:hypothetical protein
MLGDLAYELVLPVFIVGPLELEGVINLGQVLGFELGVDHRADYLDDFAYPAMLLRLL